MTNIGNLASPHRAAVDERGLLSVAGRSLDWWIGAEDRWHLPAREANVRQSFLADTPVVETRMRVPGGEAVQRAYAIRAGTDDLVIVEVENASPTPVALAIVLCAEDVRLDTATVTSGEQTVLLLPRRPNAALSGADVTDAVLAGQVVGVQVGGGPHAAFVYPLPHQAVLRVAVPISGGAPTFPSALPDAATVAKGWQTQTDRGIRIVVPDPSLQSTIDLGRRLLLLDGDADALSRFGFEPEAADALRADEPDAAWLVAVDGHVRRTGSIALAEELADRIASTADDIAVRRKRIPDAERPAAAAALASTARLLAATGHDRAARAATKAASSLGPAAPSPRSPLLEALATLVGESDDGLALGPGLPTAWRGQGVEVHDAPTRWGWLSWAVRWHGARPALLWDLTPHDPSIPVRLTAPALDPDWSTTEPRGEALLAAPPTIEAGDSFT